jgi:hypothetical protein
MKRDVDPFPVDLFALTKPARPRERMWWFLMS